METHTRNFQKGEPTSERAATPAPSTFGKSDPLSPDWDSPSVSPPLSGSSSPPPTHRIPPPSSLLAPKPVLQIHSDNPDPHRPDAEQAPPPLPTRGESRQHPGGVVRKDTSSGFDMMKTRDRGLRASGWRTRKLNFRRVSTPTCSSSSSSSESWTRRFTASGISSDHTADDARIVANSSSPARTATRYLHQAANFIGLSFSNRLKNNERW